MLDKLLSPFIGYWYWAQDRETPLARSVAMAAPLVLFGVLLYFLFLRGGDGSSLTANVTPTAENVVSSTPPGPDSGGSPVVSTGVTGTQAAQTSPAATQAGTGGSTTGPAPTAFTQMRYTVEPGDSPSVIAENVGVPLEIRNDWIEEMLALNGVTATTLQVGQELILPPF